MRFMSLSHGGWAPFPIRYSPSIDTPGLGVHLPGVRQARPDLLREVRLGSGCCCDRVDLRTLAKLLERQAGVEPALFRQRIPGGSRSGAPSTNRADARD